MNHWFCPMCGEIYDKDEGKCLKCDFPYLGYVDQIGGIHEGGCGAMPDGTECGECSKGDCSFCPVWVTHKRRKERYMQWRCPECEEILEIWYEKITEYPIEDMRGYPCKTAELIYHCKNCGCDWDSIWETQWGDVSQTPLTRHYWG